MKSLPIGWLCALAAALVLTSAAGCGDGGSTSTSAGSAGAPAGGGGAGGNTGGTGGSAGKTGGTGGSAGNTGGSGGTTGGAGGAMTCTTPADCGPPPNECTDYTCDAGTCAKAPKAAGTLAATQAPGDCQINQCDGQGNVSAAPDDTDLPDDSNPCTDDACSMGTATHSNKPAGTSCGASLICNDAGQCVGCITAVDCPGADTECEARTCKNDVCGVSFAASGTPVMTQAAGDCKKNACDGAGNVTVQNDNADAPADDGDQCTSEVCMGGVPLHPLKVAGSTCNQNGGSVCDAAGACVQCNTAAQCPGMDSPCQTRTCNAGACGVSNAPAGTLAGMQVPGDCKLIQCNGSGGVVNLVDNTDLPADDGNQCTTEVCTAGVPLHSPLPVDTACNQSGGTVCSAGAQCVQCNAASQCPGVDTECKARACTAGACGASFTPSGTPVSMQTPGDCKESQCDGAGNVVLSNKDTDLPNDINQCTNDVCAMGVPSNPPSAAGVACNQSGGVVCDGAGVCQPPPQVASVIPADGATGVATQSTIAVTFTVPMSPATLTGQTSPGPCSGSIQVSSNDFSSCIAFTTSSASMNAANTTATLTPLGRLFSATRYRVRVTTAAQSALNVALPATFTQPNGFVTVGGANACDGNLVISQAYGGGGNTGAPYLNDFVELHNIGATPVSLAGLSLQYASGAGMTWSVAAVLNNMATVAPGGYYLVQLGSGGNIGAPLSPDQTGTTNMAATAAKVALIRGTTAVPAGACPPFAQLLDLVGYGSAATCFEGTAPAPTPSNTTAALRGELGCADTNANNSNFSAAAPLPRNAAAPPAVCTCNAAINEVGTAAEGDYCNLQFPAGFSVQTGQLTPNVYGRLYELGTTPTAAAAAPNVIAQLGYGPAGSNPATSNAWLWYSAAYNGGFADPNNDEYQAQIAAPAPGNYTYTYRFSFDGLQWTYCDTDGAGSNAGLDFSPAALGTMTVTP